MTITESLTLALVAFLLGAALGWLGQDRVIAAMVWLDGIRVVGP